MGHIPGANRWLSVKQALRDRSSRRAEMIGNVAQNRGERPHPQRDVRRNGDVMLTSLRAGETNVATGLPGHSVAQRGEGHGKLLTGDIPRQFHAEMTSS